MRQHHIRDMFLVLGALGITGLSAVYAYASAGVDPGRRPIVERVITANGH